MAKAVARAARLRRAHKMGPPTQTGPRPRVQADADDLKSPPPGRALARRLAKEVERLEAELAAARAEAAALAATAERDPLTEVLNRCGFERELERSLAYVRRYGASAALIYVDLDAFKPVNDRHGHAAGDTVLKAAAAALVRNVRASDLVARLGGDEFVVLLWNIAPEDARMKTFELEDAIAAATDVGPARMAVGASAGAAMLAADDTIADVLARADAAMYARKAERRANRV